MSKIEIVLKENLDEKKGGKLLSHLEEVIYGDYEIISTKITDTLMVRDCSKECCSMED